MKQIFVDREFDRDVGGGRRRTYPAGGVYKMPDDHAAFAIENRYGHAVGEDADSTGNDTSKDSKSERRARASGSITLEALADFAGEAWLALSFAITGADPVEVSATNDAPDTLATSLVDAINGADGCPVTATLRDGDVVVIDLKAAQLGEAGNDIAVTTSGEGLSVTVTEMSGGKG